MSDQIDVRSWKACLTHIVRSPYNESIEAPCPVCEITRLEARIEMRNDLIDSLEAELEEWKSLAESLGDKENEVHKYNVKCRKENERLREAIPVVREFLWIAVCYNDHNFRVDLVQDKCRKLCKELGIKNVEDANDWLEALQK